MKKKLNNSGSVIVLIIMIISILISLGILLLNISITQLKIKRSNSEIKKTLYLSENGLNYTYVKIYNLILEACKDSLDKVNEYLLCNEDDTEAFYLFKSNYKKYIISNIKQRVNANSNPIVNVVNESSLYFSGDKISVKVQSKYTSESNIKIIAEGDFIIIVPDYYEIREGIIDYSDCLLMKNIKFTGGV